MYCFFNLTACHVLYHRTTGQFAAMPTKFSWVRCGVEEPDILGFFKVFFEGISLQLKCSSSYCQTSSKNNVTFFLAQTSQTRRAFITLINAFTEILFQS